MKLKLKDLATPKLIIYAILIFLLLIFWSGISILIRVIVVGYLIYSIVCLASERFTCPHCWLKTLIATLIVIVAFILTSRFFLVLLLLMIADLIYDYWKKFKK